MTYGNQFDEANSGYPKPKTEYDKAQREAREKGQKDAQRIAALIYADLDLEVSPQVIQRFVKSRWDKLAPLAHLVHEAPDNTKGSVK